MFPGSFEPESFAMLRVCQSIRPSSPSPRDMENQAIFVARSLIAIRNIRLLLPRRKQIPETSRSGMWTTRRTRSWFFFDISFPTMGEGLCGGHYNHCLMISRVFAQLISNNDNYRVLGVRHGKAVPFQSDYSLRRANTQTDEGQHSTTAADSARITDGPPSDRP